MEYSVLSTTTALFEVMRNADDLFVDYDIPAFVHRE
jgi:hypothetical protein